MASPHTCLVPAPWRGSTRPPTAVAAGSGQFSSDAPGVFFDGMAIWDPDHGVAFSDPVAGRFLILTSEDGGSTWTEVASDALPTSIDGEAGFAASGTNVAVFGGERLDRYGRRRRSRPALGRPRAYLDRVRHADGAWRGRRNLLARLLGRAPRRAVGGNFQQPDLEDGNAAWTDDAGATWTLAVAPPRGYRSGVAVVPGTDGPTLVAVGPGGTDVSFDGGRGLDPPERRGLQCRRVHRRGRMGRRRPTGAQRSSRVGPCPANDSFAPSDGFMNRLKEYGWDPATGGRVRAPRRRSRAGSSDRGAAGSVPGRGRVWVP